MPYLRLDLAKTYPPQTKRELATRLCHLYADVMQTQLWRPNVGIAELGEDNLFHLAEDGLGSITMVLVEIRRGRSLDRRLELGRRIVDICAEVLGTPRGRCSSNSPSIPARRCCVTANGPATGQLRRPRHSRAIPTGGVEFMGKLEGKIAVVTGGSSGIGLAAAEALVVEGAHVFVMGRRQAELDAAVASIGSNVTPVQGDVSKPKDLDRLYRQVKREKGKIDVLFANAGIGGRARLGEITDKHIDDLLSINIKGVILTVQKALPLLAPGASVILNASIVASNIAREANFSDLRSKI